MKAEYRRYLCVCAVIFLAGCSRGVVIRRVEPPAAESVSESIKLPQLPGYEKLTYDVKWLGIRIGSLSLSVLGTDTVAGKEVYVLEGLISTSNFLSRLYPISDRYVSYMDTRSLYAVPPGVQDLLSAFYHFCLIPLDAGDQVEYYVCYNEKNYRLMHFIRSRVSVRLSAFDRQVWDAFLVDSAAYHLTGEPVEKGTLKAYFSAEPRRMLLYAEIKGPLLTKVTFNLVEKKSIRGGSDEDLPG